MIVKCCVCGETVANVNNSECENEISHTYCDGCLRESIDQSRKEDLLAGASKKRGVRTVSLITGEYNG